MIIHPDSVHSNTPVSNQNYIQSHPVMSVQDLCNDETNDTALTYLLFFVLFRFLIIILQTFIHTVLEQRNNNDYSSRLCSLEYTGFQPKLYPIASCDVCPGPV
mmetsp:Transcript_8831/g.10353  ORF Transcript_8831/g.10353 Transcript_8831/m.10353 type:complete len:103 (-) Transcript_8831:14-322(-)